ncbi:glycoside hydrolase, family 18 domain protein [Leptospira fletcheri]|uniref:Glycoside hydrolase, family 18 domain protein n=1 Tax=Leptospira fletcheri TaxID=2484981 RepID=A0A4R9GG17_9LEPT|nr:glycosyl hydrolase family 18 protein [Leptospira fletcheri]TGK11622.1 glycoside hydrolase, family 18 domain protein [Leptospira fletcheri]
MRRFSFTCARIFLIFLFFLCLLAAEPHPHVWYYAIGGDLKKSDFDWQSKFQQNVTICFTGGKIGKDGKITWIEIPAYLLDSGIAKGVRWIPMFAFSSKTEGIRLLKSEHQRKALLGSLVGFFKKYPKYSGIHLDLEGLPSSSANDFKILLKELLPAFRTENRKLTIALFPQIGFSHEPSGFHSEISRIDLADEVVLMSYDLHSPKTKPGPVTGLSWTKENLTLLVKSYSPEQIWLGIPLYGYSWKTERKKPDIITRKSSSRKMAEFGRKKDGIHILENGSEFSSLIVDETDWTILVREFGIRGLAYWRLGF